MSTATSPRPASAAKPDFAEMAEGSLDAVYRYLVFLTKNPGLAEDLTAETFERALRAWRRYDPHRGTPVAWLCQIARSAALDHFRADARRRRREETYARDDGDSAEPLFGEGFSPELEAALATLSAAEREAIALRVVLELDGASAARLLGISETACSTRLSRALHKLEERMETNALA